MENTKRNSEKQNMRENKEKEMNRQLLKLKINQVIFVYKFRAHLAYMYALNFEINMSINVKSN